MSGGTRDFNSGIALTGGGTFLLTNGQLNVNVPFTQAASGVPAWQLSGATVNDSSGLTFNGPFYWFSGTMTGAPHPLHLALRLA